MRFTTRTLWKMFFLMIFTLGIYIIYWFFITKNELNQGGAKIPTAFLLFIPIANIYFLYKFAQAFCVSVLRDESRTILYFFLITFLMPAGILVYQSHINDYNETSQNR